MFDTLSYRLYIKKIKAPIGDENVHDATIMLNVWIKKIKAPIGDENVHMLIVHQLLWRLRK